MYEFDEDIEEFQEEREEAGVLVQQQPSHDLIVEVPRELKGDGPKGGPKGDTKGGPKGQSAPKKTKAPTVKTTKAPTIKINIFKKKGAGRKKRKKRSRGLESSGEFDKTTDEFIQDGEDEEEEEEEEEEYDEDLDGIEKEEYDAEAFIADGRDLTNDKPVFGFSRELQGKGPKAAKAPKDGGPKDGPKQGSKKGQPKTKSPTFKKTKAPTILKTKAPTIKSAKAPIVKKTKAPTIKKTKAPTVKNASEKRQKKRSRGLKSYDEFDEDIYDFEDVDEFEVNYG